MDAIRVKDDGGNAQVIGLAQALADSLRLAILQHLMAGPASVSEVLSVTGEAQSKVANHLALLRERGLVRTSTRRLTPWACSSLRNCSMVLVEWPMVSTTGAVVVSLVCSCDFGRCGSLLCGARGRALGEREREEALGLACCTP